MKKRKIIGIIFILLIVGFGIVFLDQSRSLLRNILPSNLKVYVKEVFFGKQFLEEVKYFRISNFHMKILPNTEFLKLKLETYPLEDLDVLEQTHYDKIKNKTSSVRTFFIDVFGDDLIIASVKGKFILLKNGEVNNKVKIDSNLKDFNATNLLDIAIVDNDIYVSFRYEPSESKCSYFYLVKAKFNNKFLQFTTFFNPKRCTVNNYGGRIASGKFNGENGIILTTGATGIERNFAQDENSHLGKILFFSNNSDVYQVISKGHRNPQGLYVEDNLILVTEHGPYGGDELNLIKKNGNYGWPISSYGETYQYLDETYNKTDFKYKKSHSEHGFTEPIFNFVPSIGISEIIKIPNNFSKYWQNNFFVASLNGVSLYRVEFDKVYSKVKYIEKIIVLERIRDIKYLKSKNTFFLSLESTGQLGLLSIGKDS